MKRFKRDTNRSVSGQSFNTFALVFGCTLGSGCFLMPGTVFLPQAGPVGTCCGIALAAVVALLILGNYSTLARQYPEKSQLWRFVSRTLGDDYAFFAVWCLLFLWLPIAWTNAASIPMVCRVALGDALTHPLLYRLGGFEVYGGELTLSALTLTLCALHICPRDGRALYVFPVRDNGIGMTEAFAGKRVLVVDDIELNRELAVDVLELYGFSVEDAENGPQAIEQVSAHPGGYYDAVLMEVQMPGMDGYEATQRIRGLEDPLRASVPIFALTANAFEEDRRRADAAGYYVMKLLHHAEDGDDEEAESSGTEC